MEGVVRGVESLLRRAALCGAAFVCGAAASPAHVTLVRRVLELCGVAWGTCLVCLGLSWMQRRRWRRGGGGAEPLRGEADAQASVSTPMMSNLSAVKPPARDGVDAGPPRQRGVLGSYYQSSLLGESGPTKKRPRDSPNPVAVLPGDRARSLKPPSSKVLHKAGAAGRQQPSPSETSSLSEPPLQQHPQLESLYVMSVGTHDRIFPNVAYDIDNDLFRGKMLLMFRTPDVDDAAASPAFRGGPLHERTVRYLRGKQRRFEFQWQFRLKKLPPGDVLMSMEAADPIRMGVIQRAAAAAALKFVQKLNPGFTYFFSNSAASGPTHLSFPVGTSMDRFNATPHFDSEGRACALPALGEEIMEDAEAIRQRKNGVPIQWSTDNTYTMALWSAYFDWLDWQVVNFPGIRPFSVTSVAGMQPIIMTLCTTSGEGEAAEDTTEQPRRDKIVAIEVSNALKSTVGSEAKRWISEAALREKRILAERQQQQEQLLTNINRPSNPSEAYYSSDENESFCDDDEEDRDTTEGEEELSDIEDPEDDNMEEAKVMDEVEHETPPLDDSCYLRCGFSICLREGTDNYVASGGGFAVLQSTPTACITLQKMQPKKKKRNSRSSFSTLVQNGDVVQVKLVDGKAIKYLSLHRGWWLRWNSTRPKRDGLFRICTDGPSGSLVVLGDSFSLVCRRWSRYLIGVCMESSAKYGGRMLGIYKAGKNNQNFFVGDEVLREDGMVPLLLYAQAYDEGCDCSSPTKTPARGAISEPTRQTWSAGDVAPLPMLGETGTEQIRYEIDVPAWLEVMDRTKRTKQLVYAVRVKEIVVTKKNPNQCMDTDVESPELAQQIENRNQNTCVSNSRMFVKFRTGHDLAPLFRLGAEYTQELSQSSDQLQQSLDFQNQDDLNGALSSSSCSSSTSSSSDDFDSDEELDDEEEPSHFLIAGPNHSALSDEELAPFPDVQQGQDAISPATDSAAEEENGDFDESDRPNRKEKRECAVKCLSGKSMRNEKSFELETEDLSRVEGSMSTMGSKIEIGTTTPCQTSPTTASLHVDSHSDPPLSNSNDAKKKNKTKHAAMMGRVAKTVKASTVITGKHVIKTSMTLGKGTVSAGRAAGRVIPVSSVVYNYKPPRKHEPGGRVNTRRNSAMNNKEISRAIKNIEGKGNFSTSYVAGQLSTTDQRCRKVSRILSDMSNASNNSSPVCSAISSFVSKKHVQDLSILRGSLRTASAAELGVKLKFDIDCVADIDCVVARSIYSGRWREELCVLYTKAHRHLAFYAPLAKKPCLVVSFEEILSARKCDDEILSDLPGFHLLSLDTQWKCHYIAFLDKIERDNFLTRLEDALIHKNRHPTLPSKVAQECESYRMSLETSLTGTVGKWRPVSTSKNKQVKLRRILNARRMNFDVVPVTAEKEAATNSNAQSKIAIYVENLLRMALSFSPDALNATDARFTDFLDETCRLRTLPLHEIDLTSKEAFCIFVNLYHCLLQHSLLLAVDGLPTKQSVMHFKRCSCYEIGEDVFSLAELECCVIRVKTSRKSNIKFPFVGVAKKSRIYRRIYGLDSTDQRINFILNNGDMAYPPSVPVLQPQNMDELINRAAFCFLMDQVKIDAHKKSVFLPKVCDVYRMGDGLVSLSQCLIHLDESKQLAIGRLLDNGVVSVKFRRNCEDFHPNLTELRL